MRTILFLTTLTIYFLLPASCVNKQVEPELEILFTELKKRSDPHELENFKLTPREVAIVNHEIFNNVIKYPFDIFLDPVYDSLFIDFWSGKARRPDDQITEILFVISYHAWLNDEKIDLEILEEEAIRYQQLLRRKDEFKFLKKLNSEGYYRFFLPVNDSIRIAIHKDIYSKISFNDEQKEYYFLKALDSIIDERMEEGIFSYDDWATYKNKKELDHLMELFGEEDLPCQ